VQGGLGKGAGSSVVVTDMPLSRASFAPTEAGCKRPEQGAIKAWAGSLKRLSWATVPAFRMPA